MPLPLAARKSIRDNEEHLTNAVETIKSALGVEWTFEFDFETLLAKVESADYVKNDPGSFFYKDVATNVAECVKSFATKDEMVKEALIEANANSKVIVRVNEDKKNTSYWKYIFENNNLVLLFRASPANISDITYFDLPSIIPSPGVLSLKARLNLKENGEKFQTALEEIKEATKNDWTYDESSIETCYTTFDFDKDRIGDIFAEIITNIAYNIKTRCKDEMILEAFNEVNTNNKIVFRHLPKQSDYWTFAFTSGDLIVSYKSICNVSDIEQEFSSIHTIKNQSAIN
ncbi:hypothetical protein PPL_04586 [Heterostelium album PN500]|uniref:Uncharacterized protein n=1 Tax=Heterostelium pallidum (strain ATCC 26659 / Pp 5 / PN500) TaxID=670386 RepID=D3B7Z8_HETP5|nr:hypothetical protein PPL_04586 [Heterostelium album PN500]EFA82166.1 hypothetical protein PPL_04586 [Heterostelium album PN500]|eukprot:XP_020434283.1 hypothetical protein PPL_04586 [Heterostelium album PN500]